MKIKAVICKGIERLVSTVGYRNLIFSTALAFSCIAGLIDGHLLKVVKELQGLRQDLRETRLRYSKESSDQCEKIDSSAKSLRVY